MKLLFFFSKSVRVHFSPQQRLLRGTALVVRATSLTLGPSGSQVLIEYPKGPPKITKDGVTVAKSVQLQDPVQEMGANICRHASGLSNMEAGDGTTTTTVLTGLLLQLGFRGLNNGLSIQKLREGFKIGEEWIIDFLKLKSRKISRPHELTNVALVSTNYDRQLSSLAVNAILRSQNPKAIKFDQSRSEKNSLAIEQCFKLTRSPDGRFLNEKKQLRLQYPCVLIVDSQINSLEEIHHLLGKLKAQKRSLLIFAKHFSESAVSSLFFNHSRGILNACPITLVGTQQQISIQTKDLSIIFKTQVFRVEQLIDVQPADLGNAKQLISDQFELTVFGIQNDPQQVSSLGRQISQLPKTAFNQQRLQRILTKRVVVMVGGKNQLQVNERRDKITDAVNAIMKAMQNGVLPGGGVSLLRSTAVLSILQIDPQVKFILEQALSSVFLTLRPQTTAVELAKLKEMEFETGYDLRDGSMCNLVQRGVVEGSSVLISSLRNSLRTAMSLLGCEVVITYINRVPNIKLQELDQSYKM